MFDHPQMTQKLSELKVDDLRRQARSARRPEARAALGQRLARPLRRLRAV